MTVCCIHLFTLKYPPLADYVDSHSLSDCLCGFLGMSCQSPLCYSLIIYCPFSICFSNLLHEIKKEKQMIKHGIINQCCITAL